jgi:hypothetical protein
VAGMKNEEMKKKNVPPSAPSASPSHRSLIRRNNGKLLVDCGGCKSFFRFFFFISSLTPLA